MAYLHVDTGTLRIQTERVEGHAWFAHRFSITVVLEETAGDGRSNDRSRAYK
jgi:hypothetical protein